MADIQYSDRLDGIDWAALKAALVADDFDNGRTADEYRRAHENSHAVVFAHLDGEFVANGRVLSDGVCNAYLVDIWTASAYRRRGVGRQVVRRLLATVPGQHAALFTDHYPAFYAALGFRDQVGGMSQMVGTWLRR
ncbi:MAG: GNAT family N-acetyltransferase [Actinomycetota bacterium]|nr:GNAT family N-acetyltransferase [Actinomycetota bacterium]